VQAAADRERWIDERLAELTTDEKISLVAGADAWRTAAIGRLGIPSMKVSDGPNGARGDATSGATAACFPVGAALGATWNPALLEEVGVALGQEAKTKGAQLLLAPTVNIHRTPLAGRNFECYSEDPWLTARLAIGFIDGVQSEGVGACIKHYVGNESEFQRMTMSSVIPERALREIYLLPFELAVAEAAPWSVMGAYNRVDGEHACANPRLLLEILKGEWGFDGALISDWGAIHDAVASANGGCDLEMPGPPKHFGAPLVDAVASGDVDMAVIDDKVRRVLRMVTRSGRVEHPDEPAEESVDRAEHRDLARRAACESMVLLKNEPRHEQGPLLPLAPSTFRRLAVIGPLAERGSIMGGGSSIVRAHHQVHPLPALRDRLGDDVAIVHASGGPIDRFVPNPHSSWFVPLDDGGRGLRIEYLDTHDVSTVPLDLAADDERRLGERLLKSVSWVWWLPPSEVPPEVTWGARWRGELSLDADGPWTLGVAAVGRSRVFVDETVVLDNWTDPRPGALFFGWGSDEVVATIELSAGRHALRVEYQPDERADRPAIRFGMRPVPPGDPVADAAALAADADAVLLLVGTDGEWETEGSDRVAMRLPGRQDELVAAVAAANPRTIVVLNTGSPVEMPWEPEVAAILQAWFPGQEYGDALVDVLLGEADPGGRLPTTFPHRYLDNPTLFTYPGEAGEVVYGEGVFVGYRAYDTQQVEPLFPFGHGLSYTEFRLGAARVEAGVAPGSFTVTVPVTNTGARDGSTVVQLYVAPVAPRLMRPEKELKAFAKVSLAAAATADVQLELDPRSFAAFDPAVPGWVADAGRYDLLIGTSSRALVERVPVVLDAPVVRDV
jgi:beta-glucosidase